tara:strand:- start:16764 stop:18344 length:1581 start_codon:yes stop_codon:yes gene_type:complete
MSEIRRGNELRDSLIEGINLVTDVVRPTLGAGASTVLLERENDFPLALNDGVSIAKSVSHSDPFVNMGVNLIQQVSSEAQAKSGDGTTTATILAQKMCQAAITYYDFLDKLNPSMLKIVDNMEASVESMIEGLTTIARPLATKEDLFNVAYVAGNNDSEIGEILSKAFDVSNKFSTVTLQPSKNTSTTIETQNGFEIPSGYISHYFAPEGKLDMKDAYVVLTTEVIDDFSNMIPALELAKGDNKPILFICRNVSGNALPNLLVNVANKAIDACIVKVPAWGEEAEAWLDDIGCITGAKVFKQGAGDTITELVKEDLGDTVNITVKETSTVISQNLDTDTKVKRFVQDKDEYILSIGEGIEELNDWDAEKLNNRIARLQGKVSIVHVGGNSELEIRERLERFDDAINATKAALQSGVVYGGGLAYLQVLYSDAGWKNSIDDIIQEACWEIPIVIRYNSDRQVIERTELYHNFMNGDWYDAKLKKLVPVPYEYNILDPLDVVISSLRSAMSISRLVLTTEVAVALPTE